MIKRIEKILASQRADRWFDLAGLFGLYVFSFGIFYKKAMVKNGFIFMAIGAVFNIRLVRTLIGSPLFWIAVLFFLFVSARGIAAALEFKDYHELILNRALLYGCTFFWILLVAYWMGKARAERQACPRGAPAQPVSFHSSYKIPWIVYNRLYQRTGQLARIYPIPARVQTPSLEALLGLMAQ